MYPIKAKMHVLHKRTAANTERIRYGNSPSDGSDQCIKTEKRRRAVVQRRKTNLSMFCMLYYYDWTSWIVLSLK